MFPRGQNNVGIPYSNGRSKESHVQLKMARRPMDTMVLPGTGRGNVGRTGRRAADKVEQRASAAICVGNSKLGFGEGMPVGISPPTIYQPERMLIPAEMSKADGGPGRSEST
jgi:hypothetical protein